MCGVGESEGVRAKAVISAPTPPRLFILKRDGSGSELLRPQDMKEWQDSLTRQADTLQVHTTTTQVHPIPFSSTHPSTLQPSCPSFVSLPNAVSLSLCVSVSVLCCRACVTWTSVGVLTWRGRTC